MQRYNNCPQFLAKSRQNLDSNNRHNTNSSPWLRATADACPCSTSKGAIVTQHCTISSACTTSKGAKSAPTRSSTSSPGRRRIARIAQHLPNSHPNAGQRRRQQHKAQRAATKQASKQGKKYESTTSRPTTRSISNPSKPTKRHGSKITSDTVNHVSSVFAEPPPSHPESTPEPITPSSLPAHAFWTAKFVVDPSTGTAMEYPQLKLGEDSKLWLAAASREIGRLAQGKQPDMPTGCNTMHFLDHRNLPADRKATYLRIVAAIKMHKVETHRIRFTVGGNRIDYKGKVSTPTANLETIKLLLNSTVSTPNAKMLTADIECFYLGTPMDRYEYMRIPAKDIPANIMEQYNLAPLVHNGHVLTEIQKGVYGLPQAGILAYSRLVTHLALSGYTPVQHTPGLFRHAT
jgi:hypothetical protein